MVNTITIRASAKGVRQSPRKVSLVASLVRGRSVSDALIILQHTPKRAAKPVSKAIESAKANALSSNLVEKSLVIDQLQVTAGPRIKRYNPAAFGRALPYLKRSSHIYVQLSGDIKPAKPAAAKKPVSKKEAK